MWKLTHCFLFFPQDWTLEKKLDLQLLGKSWLSTAWIGKNLVTSQPFPWRTVFFVCLFAALSKLAWVHYNTHHSAVRQNRLGSHAPHCNACWKECKFHSDTGSRYISSLQCKPVKNKRKLHLWKTASTPAWTSMIYLGRAGWGTCRWF